MKYAVNLFLVANIILFSGCATDTTNTTTSMNTANNPQPACIIQKTITAATAIPNWSSQETIPATNIDEYDKLESVAQFFWFNSEANAVYVDGDFFSDLTTVDATNLSKESTTIGSVLPDIFKHIEPQALIMLLIETHVIRTYAHLDADVCLTNDEFTKGGDYLAHFTAVHRYCTNDCYEDEYTFTVKLRKNGSIQIQP